MSYTLYYKLSVVRTSMMNVIGNMYIDGKPRNLPQTLADVAEELFEGDEFLDGLDDLTNNELIDLGFNEIVLNLEDGFMWLFPAWLAPFIPKGTELETVDGKSVIVGIDPLSIYADHWLNVGIRLDNPVWDDVE